MDELRYANIALDIFSIILSVLPIVYLVSNHRYRQKLNQYFLGICISNIFMIGGNLPDWLLPTAAEASEKCILSAASAVYYIASAFVLYFFIWYVMEYLQITGRAKKFSYCMRCFYAACRSSSLRSAPLPVLSSI